MGFPVTLLPITIGTKPDLQERPGPMKMSSSAYGVDTTDDDVDESV